MIQIREAQPEDAASIQVLEEHMKQKLSQIYRQSEFGLANIKRKQDNKSISPIKYSTLIAFFNQEAIGTIQFTIENEILNVYGLSIHADYRRNGYAREIKNHLVSFAKEKKLKAIRCNTMKETGNVQIFQKFGFEIINEKPSVLCEGLNGEPVIDVQMELKIKE